MSDNVETTTTSSANDQAEKETKSDVVPTPSFNDVNTSTPVRLFGQFKQNGFGFNNLSPSTFGQSISKETKDDQNSSSTYFTTSLSKISSTITTGFGSSSTPLAASLASLGANKPLFGGSSGTTHSSFTDIKGMPTNSKKEHEANEENGDDENNEEGGGEEEEEEEKASLLESVAEYEAKHASIHAATTIQGDTSTGEENEITKFQMAGKLFIYNGEQQQFVERGYGILKINESHDPSDWDRLQARLIMRLDKCFRVILNSPIFPKMTVERVTDRSIRFGAQDESQLRVFIIKASANDCSNFLKELQSRIQIIERQQTSNTPTKILNTSASSDVITLDDTPPKQNISTSTRKRSHSQSDSDVSDKTNDLSKKSKVVEGYRESNKNVNQSTSEEDSFEINKSNEQETANS